MRRLLVATAIAMFAIPGFADHRGGSAVRGLSPTSPIGSHDVGGTDPRHMTRHGDEAASAGSGSPHEVFSPGSGPTEPIGSHDLGGTDPRHAASHGASFGMPGGASGAYPAPWSGPTDPIGSPEG